MLTLKCKCGTMLRVDDKFAGQKVRCPSCKTIVSVPAQGAGNEHKEGVQARQPAAKSSPTAEPPKGPPPLRKVDDVFATDDAPKPKQGRPVEDVFADEDSGKRAKRDDADDDEDEPRGRRGAARDRADRDDDDRGRRRSRRDEDDDYDDDRRGRRGRRSGRSDETSGKAIASLICGIGGFVCFPVLPGIPGFILGLMALGDINRRDMQGKGLAIAGLILSVLNVLACCPVALLVPAVQKVREAAARTQAVNNAKMLSLSFHEHNDRYRNLPGPQALKSGGLPGQVSWRVGLLPYIGEDPLYRRFAIDQPWDSPQNRALLPNMPKTYWMAHVADPRDPNSETYYQIFTGPDTPFRPGDRPAIPRTFTDGTSNTLLFAQANYAVPWVKIQDIAVQPNQPLPLPETFIAALADGSVRIIDRKRVSDQTLRLLINPSDGQALPPWE